MRAIRRKAFTLMEIMVAVVIFSLVVSSLVVSFRTGVKAYDIGATHAELDQTIRFVTSQVAEDLRNVFYRQPWTYNVTRNQREELLAQREQQLQASGARTELLEDESLPDLGPRIDLSFRAKDNGDQDELSFVRVQNENAPETRKPFGLARVRYFLIDGSLYRAVDDVIAPEVDEFGNEIPKPVPPVMDKLANNVKSVDLKFGYYYDGEWLLADDWDSDAAQYRNPSDEAEEKGKITQFGASGSNRSASDAQAQGTTTGGYTATTQRRTDDLPAWVEITYTFTDPKKAEKERKFRQVIQIYSSQETYLPPDVTDGDSQRDIFRTRRRSSER
ncbi:MAG: prepilin-type N-terminal cleavage/methylation domain-containing protein [Candidatus Sumerlaeaceae bacterium]|jgi:prepilin-type N-terminal cleavage/methylation domain-containing protein